MTRLHAAAMAALLASFANPAPATGADAAPAALEKCVAERDDTRRLACFDAAMARLATLPPAAPPPTQEEKFGARGDLRRDIERQERPHEAPLDKLEGTVSAIAARADGTLVVTLDNQQVWQQLTGGEGFRLKAGDKVTLKPGVLGSYFLVSPYGRSTKVKRLK